ncbi:beta-galactosidase [Mucilaginibacter sp.]|uniref:beta-galactosidase n=1 Tax=Mucilaginibacter sp. TaxID=1882438 RepID=UPI0025CF6FE7|nr:beta-galactosidase [Mucilaginibacter sp.]
MDQARCLPATYPVFYPAVNGEDNPAKVKELINKYHNGKGPYYIAEWYPGWFDSWGKPHSGSNADEDAKKLDEVLAAGISINMYMFHGGTTRDFMNGANMSRNEPYSPQTSSYDYDAPLNEAGDPTPKFYKLRNVIAKHLPAGQTLPEIPQKRRRTYALEVTKVSGVANLFNNLGLPTESERPMSFEDLDQGYGLVLYRTTLANASNGLLKIKQLRDYATVYVNGKRLAVLDRRLGQDSVQLAGVSPNSTLDILVENNGRINYGPYLTDNRKGITEAVILNGQELLGWKMYKFPLNSTSGFKYITSNGEAIQQPVLYRGTFSLRGVGDTYLDMRAFGKGIAFVNGHNLGKYWYIGPQQTLFVPAAWLKKGTNEIVIFDELHNTDVKEITTIEHPILNELHK